MKTSAWLLGAALFAMAPAGSAQSAASPQATTAPLSASLSAEDRALRANFGLQALDRYLETWNSRDPERWSTALAFPHIRPGAGAFKVYPDKQSYIADVDFEETMAAGWRYTRWDRREVLQVGPEKVHVAGWWRRYTEDGNTQFTGQMVYVIVPVDGRVDGPWRIQARFAAGRGGDLTPAQEREKAGEARAGLDRYIAALNTHAADPLADAVHYPHVRHGDGVLETWSTRAEYLAGAEPGRARTWAKTRIRDVRTIAVSPFGANFTLILERLDDGGRVLQRDEALILVTQSEGDPAWKVRAISVFGT